MAGEGRQTRIPLALAVAALAAMLALALPGAEAAKTGKKAGALKVSKQVNLVIPDKGPGTAPVGILTSTINAGKRFSGLRVRDVNVTIQATGVDADAVDNLLGLLTAPNGATSTLFAGLEGLSIGPLTFTDESPLITDVPPCDDPTALCPPYAGAVEPGTPLATMDNGRVKGAWTLTIVDGINGEASVLNSWRLQVVTGRPYATK